jgi:hypothetical protein
MQSTRARCAVVHWVRFTGITPAEALALDGAPDGVVGWKSGPDGPLMPDGMRGPSDTWCAVALYPDEATARAALGRRDVPAFAAAVEHWQVLLRPVAHRGECNHLDRAQPGLIFTPSTDDPGGPVFVMTTAGFVIGPQLDVARVIRFRRHVDLVRESYRAAPGWLNAHVFTPVVRGDDGVTMTIWRSDAEMIDAAYRPGTHRAQLDEHRQQPMCDRTSFTRLRMIESAGTWHGRDPLADARAAHDGMRATATARGASAPGGFA